MFTIKTVCVCCAGPLLHTVHEHAASLSRYAAQQMIIKIKVPLYCSLACRATQQSYSRNGESKGKKTT